MVKIGNVHHQIRLSEMKNGIEKEV